MNAIMNEKGRQTKLLAAIAIIAMVVCALAVVMPSGQVDAVDDSTSADEARIGDTSYLTFEAAVDVATDGDTIEILKNVDVESAVVITDKTITIDLNNYTINSTNITTSGYAISVGDGSDVTINGPGKLTNSYELEDPVFGVIQVTAGATLTMNNVTVEGKQYGVIASGIQTAGSGATDADRRNESITDDTEFACYLYMNECTMISPYGGFGMNGNYGFQYIEMTDCTLNCSEGTAIYVPSNAKVIITGTTITAQSGIDQRTGWVEIRDSTITYSGPGDDKEQGDGPTAFGVGIAVIDSGYTNADVTTIIENVTFTSSSENETSGDVLTGVYRSNSADTPVDGITSPDRTVTATHDSYVSIDGLEFTSKQGETISASVVDDGNITVGKASKVTATENFTLGEGKTLTVYENGTVEAAPGVNIDLTKATVSASSAWSLNIGAGASAALPEITASTGTATIPTVNAVSTDAEVTIDGESVKIKEPYTPTIEDQYDLEQALNMGVSSITLSQKVDITKDIDMGSVAITASDNYYLDVAEGVTVTFTGGSYVGKVTGNGVSADINLNGSFTLKAGSIIVIDLSSNEKNSITVDDGTTVVLQGALNADLTVTMNGTSTLDLNNVNITSAGKLTIVENASATDKATYTATGTVSVYGQIMAKGTDGNTAFDGISIEVQDNTTFRAYGGSVLQDTVSVIADPDAQDADSIIINLDGAMYTLTINDDINSSNVYGQTQTVVIGSTLDIVSGTTIIIQGQFVVNEGVTLTIQNGAKLIINGTTSVMDVNGNIIVEDGGILEVQNSQAVDIAGAVEIYGDMDVKGGAVTVQENGNVTVAVGGELTVSAASGSTVAFDIKAGAAVDILGGFTITTPITNAGTISLTGAVMNGASNITLKNGGTVNINSYTIGKGVTSMGLTVTDGQNSIKFTAPAAQTGFSGAVITTASVKDADNNNAEVFTMSVSGSIGAVDNIGDDAARTYTVDISGSTTVAKAKVSVSGDLTVGEDVSVTNSGKLEVSGTVTTTAGTFNNGVAGVIDVTGTVTVTGSVPLDGTVNAAYYVTTVTTGTNAGTTTTYTTFEDAVQSGATRVTVGVGSATVVVTGSVTVPGTVTNVTVSSGATLQVGATDNRDITVTVSDGSRVTGKIVVLATMTFENSRNDNAAVTSDVVINESPARTYTNLYTALASGAETVTLAGPVTLTSNITVPEGTTLVVPAGTGVQFNEGVTMTVDGAVQTAVDFTCLNDDDGNTVTFTDKSASTTDNTAKIVVNGEFMSSVTGRTDAGMYDLYKIPGAYYDISNSTGAFTVIAPVATAAAEAAADIVDGQIFVFGEVSMGDVAFNGTADDNLTIVVFGKATGNVTLSYAAFGVLDATNASSALGTTFGTNGQFTGSVSTAVGSVDIVNVTNIAIADLFVEEDGSDVEYMTLTGTPAPVDDDVDASLTVASGNVTVPAVASGNALAIAETQVTENNETVTVSSVAFEVASGATLTVNGAVDVYDVTVNGTVTAVDGGRLVSDCAYVFGTLTVAETDTAAKIGAGSAEIATLYVGLDKKYDNMTAATVDGQVGNVRLMVVSSESTVSEGLLDDFSASTAFNVEGSVWFTAYASNNVEPVTVDDVKVENALFIGWSDEENGDAIKAANSTPENVVYQTTFNVGQYDTLYAVVDYEIYTVTITADAGIGTVAVDGKVLMKTDNVFIITGLTAGSHTIDYILNSGFEGTPTITVNGTAIPGNTFTLSGTDDLTVEISIYGTQPAAPSQGGSTVSGDDGFGLTDYLLIILVILIVIMAIIVAMRLMRS